MVDSNSPTREQVISCPHATIRAMSPGGACIICGVVAGERPPAKVNPQFSPEDAAALLVKIRALLARRKLSAFIRRGWHVLEPATPLLWNWHIDAIADHVQWLLDEWLAHKRDAVYKQPVRDMVINVPPGTAKSYIVTAFAPAWMWLHFPEWRVICLSANPRVLTQMSLRCRELVASEWYQSSFHPDWAISDSQDSKTKFANSRGGSRSAVGMEANIIGDRADALFVDDPHDAYDVHSPVTRQATLDNWDQAVRNRVNEPMHSTRLIIMQRLHEDDLSGHVLRQGIDCHLRIPMEFEPESRCITKMPWADPRTQPGELLHPARFSREILDKEKIALGSMGYAGQMQQAPAPAEGGMFRRDAWRWFRIEGQGSAAARRPSGCTEAPARVLTYNRKGSLGLDGILVSVDASVKKTDAGSRTSMLVIGYKGADRFIMDNVTRPMDFNDQVAAIQALHARYPNATKYLIEAKANGAAIIDFLTSKISGLIPVEPEGGKESRAAASQPQVEAGNVYILEGAEWADDFVGELGTFPNGSKDDQVDALSQALIYLHSDLNIDRWRGLGL